MTNACVMKRTSGSDVLNAIGFPYPLSKMEAGFAPAVAAAGSVVVTVARAAPTMATERTVGDKLSVQLPDRETSALGSGSLAVTFATLVAVADAMLDKRGAC